MKILIEIDKPILDCYDDMNTDMFNDKIKSSFAYKLMKLEFEKKIVKSVMDAYKKGGKE